METTRKTLRGIVASVVMALVLAVGVVPATGAPSEDYRAFADESAAALSINAGAAVKTTNNADGTATYTFPYLTVQAPADKRIKGITVQFTSAIESGEDVLLSNASITIDGRTHSFQVLNANKKGNKSANDTGAEGASAEFWQEYLRANLSLKLKVDSQSVKSMRMIASLEKVTRTLDYNAQNGHYYEYVATPVNWPTARDRAAQATYMGLQGYLVTVTSQAEHDLIYSLVNANTWIGATCHPTFLAAAGIDATGAYSSTYAKYHWVTGPEKGTLFWRGGYGIANANTAANQVDGAYTNWAAKEPNNSNGEQCAHLYTSVGGKWNDFSYATNCNYVIEYGGLEDDTEGPGADGNPGGSGSDGDADQEESFVKVDISIDTQGKTMHVEAADTVVGSQPQVTATVNGGTVPSVLGDASISLGTGAAELTHRYQRFDEATGTWADVAAEEVCQHAGRYRVQVQASYKELAADGGWVTDETGAVFVGAYKMEAGFEDGVEFTVAPKPLDIARPAPAEPGDPEGDDPTTEVAARTYSKVYDGTTAFDAAGLSLSDMAVEGADVHLTFQSAAFASPSAGVQQLTFQGIGLAGADAADYSLADVAPDGAITVHGTILPRPLDLRASFSREAGWPEHGMWTAGVDMSDPAAGDASPYRYYTDARAFEYGFQGAAGNIVLDADCPDASSWPANMLCPGDAITEALGTVRFTCKTQDDLALNRANPQIGTYALEPHFSKVNPVGAASAPVRPDGRYAVGNYAVSIEPTYLEVVARPEAHVVEKELVLDRQSGRVLTAYEVAQQVIAAGVEGVPALPAEDQMDVLLKKGSAVVGSIDCGTAGQYHASIFVRGSDGRDVLISVDIRVVGSTGGSIGEGPSTGIVSPGFFTVRTKMEGDVGASTCTPSAIVPAGSKASVAWAPGADRYVASVSVDGVEHTAKEAALTFENITADHEVVVTFAKIGSIGGSTTHGFYTITVNRYGEASKVQVSPSAVVRAGESSTVTWAPDAGYKVSEVLVDGVRLSAEQAAAGSYAFDGIAANHVVDVRCAPAGSGCTLAGAEFVVSTRIAGGTGTITGGATVAAGSSYTVSWDIAARAASGAAYEVKRVEVNGVAVSGAQSASVVISNIRSDQDVVVYVEPALNHVSIMGLGAGDTSPSKTLYRGQSYSGIIASPSASARVYRVEIDGVLAYEAGPAREADEEGPIDEALDDIAAALDELADDAEVTGGEAAADDEALPEEDAAPAPAVPDEEAAAPVAPEAPADPSPEAPDSSAAEPESPSDGPDAADGAAEGAPAAEAGSERMAGGAAGLQLVHAVSAYHSLEALYREGGVVRATAPQPNESLAYRMDDASGTFHVSISDISSDHTIKVYFAEKDASPTVDELRAEEGAHAQVTATIGGGPGTVTGDGFVKPGSPGPTISWELPNPPKHEVTGVVVNGQHYDVPDPDASSFDFPFELAPGAQYEVEVITQPRVPGDIDVPVRPSMAQASVLYQVRTSVVGGPATISPSASVAEDGDYEVSWAAQADDGAYRVTRVVVDGRAADDLVADEGAISFTAVRADHDVQVVLDRVQPDGPAAPAPDGQESPVQRAGSLTALPQTGDPLTSIASALGLAALLCTAATFLARRRIRSSRRG